MRLLFQYLVTPIAVFWVGYILLRLAGKRAVQEMNSFDLLIVMVTGTAIAEPIVTKDLGVATWYSLAVMGTYVVFQHLILNNTLKKALVPNPTVLVRNGHLDERGLRKVHMTVDEFLGKLRIRGYTKTSDVEIAVMEENGEISVIPKADNRPLQASDLGISLPRTFIPIPLVIDGELIEPNMAYLGIEREDLLEALKEYDLKEITLAVYNKNGGVDVDTTRTVIKPGPFNFRPGGPDSMQDRKND